MAHLLLPDLISKNLNIVFRIKYLITTLSLIASLQACQNQPETSAKETPIESEKQPLSEVKQNQKEVSGIPDSIRIWTYDYNTDLPRRNRKVNADTLNPLKLVEFVNTTRRADSVRIELVKVSSDTIFVKIRNSTYLTQRMGTTGARIYISTTTFTLTELKGIEFVDFDFEEGDHAWPGTYSRQFYYDEFEESIKANGWRHSF